MADGMLIGTVAFGFARGSKAEVSATDTLPLGGGDRLGALDRDRRRPIGCRRR